MQSLEFTFAKGAPKDAVDDMSANLLDLAPPDVQWFQERSDIVLVPIGSCEQHGAHLPLGTDTITALEVARRAAAKAEVRRRFLPPLLAHLETAGLSGRSRPEEIPVEQWLKLSPA